MMYRPLGFTHRQLLVYNAPRTEASVDLAQSETLHPVIDVYTHL
jgi:hypothetical protein